MKRAFAVIIPLVLVLALLGTACWYFGYERPDLTTGVLLDQAENMVQEGRYERAITYYSWAWFLEPHRDDIPIDLAETYVAAGNYTKAEYTLVKAISNHPHLTELYAALCRTYVAQDKLLDAVQMLDRTTDPTVKAELDAMRPAAPVVTPESGYYNDYISITVETDAEAAYITANGQYPSTELDRYSAPVTLPSGETTVLVVAVDESGLVSPEVRNGYTVGGIIEAVTLTDPAVEQALREVLNLDADDAIMTDKLWAVTQLTLPETVEDLSDLRLLTGLQSLTVQNVSGLDFTILNQLPALQELDLSGCTISSNAMEAIGSLVHLQKLSLNGCALTDITPFSQLTGLKEVHFANNLLNDVAALSLMPELEIADLAHNPLTSIAGLTTCSKIQYVDITGCSVHTLGSLSGKTDLHTVLASDNDLTDLDDLINCESLKVLEASRNKLEDVAVLPWLPKLERFVAEENAISEFPQLDPYRCSLIYVDLDHNLLEDISGLMFVHSLNYLYVDYNNISDLTPVADCRNLVQVNAWDNPITEESVEALTAVSIILNHNPNFVAPETDEAEDE